MIEPLVSDALESVSSQALLRKLVFKDITFKDGKLWQPRYESFVDYRRVPGLQVEPAFQIRERNVKVEVTFEIKKGEGITFVREGAGVLCRSLANPKSQDIPGLETRWESERRCTLIWNQSDARRAGAGDHHALRIFCQGGRRPANRWEEKASKVEGGLNVAILFRPRPIGLRSALPALTLRGPWPILERLRRLFSRSSGKPEIRIHRIDKGQAIYDLFRPSFLEQVPPELELEPAFRAPEGESELNLALGISELRWLSSGGQVKCSPWPQQLQSAKVSQDGKVCQMHWLRQAGRSASGLGGSILGSLSSFDFIATPSPALERKLHKLFPGVDPQTIVAEVAIDPTVIEPPTCTPDGVCIPPGGPRGS